MSARCVLVFGVSGVGKTSACDRFVARHADWLHFRASELLRRVTDKDPQQLRLEPANAIRANQALLAVAVQDQRRAFPKRHFLIDAHAIIDNDEALVRVPVDAVRAIAPDAVILLEAPPREIEKRRARDKRMRPQRSLAEIEQERLEERETVLDYASQLAVPMATGEVIGEFELDPLIAALG